MRRRKEPTKEGVIKSERVVSAGPGAWTELQKSEKGASYVSESWKNTNVSQRHYYGYFPTNHGNISSHNNYP
jgi:hypothetical protein